MKKKIVILLGIAVLMTGCAVTKGTRTLKYGSNLSGWSARGIWASEGITFKASDGTFTTSMDIAKTGTDAATAAAVTEAAVTAAIKGAK